METINVAGITLDEGILCIDTSKWVTQAGLAKKLNIDRNIINNLVRRDKIPHIYIRQFNLHLVPNLLNCNELEKLKKNSKKS